MKKSKIKRKTKSKRQRKKKSKIKRKTKSKRRRKRKTKLCWKGGASKSISNKISCPTDGCQCVFLISNECNADIIDRNDDVEMSKGGHLKKKNKLKQFGGKTFEHVWCDGCDKKITFTLEV